LQFTFYELKHCDALIDLYVNYKRRQLSMWCDKGTNFAQTLVGKYRLELWTLLPSARKWGYLTRTSEASAAAAAAAVAGI
jgi:hypothetical protein